MKTEELETYVNYEVKGAGTLRISKQANWSCRMSKGFGIGVSWGKYSYAGGVLPMEQAKQLANHILNELKERR